jgi:hypothetical protein
MPQQTGKPITASCHCGAVRLELRRRPRQLTDCNCSICRRYGALWSYHTATSVKVIRARPDALAAYAWGNKSLNFRHCRTCGCVVYHEPARRRRPDSRLGVNARLMAPEDIAGVRIRRLDGAATWKYLD